MDVPEWLKKSPHRPDNDVVGDESAETIFVAVGRLTHAWETVEGNMAFIFLHAVQSNHLAAIRAFGSIAGSKNRVDMINSAVDALSMQPVLRPICEEVKDFTKVFTRIAALRNIIAHGVVAIDEGSHFVVRADIAGSGRYFLTPAYYNTNKTGSILGARIWYSSKTIIEIYNFIVFLKRESDIIIIKLQGQAPEKYDFPLQIQVVKHIEKC